ASPPNVSKPWPPPLLIRQEATPSRAARLPRPTPKFLTDPRYLRGRVPRALTRTSPPRRADDMLGDPFSQRFQRATTYFDHVPAEKPLNVADGHAHILRTSVST